MTTNNRSQPPVTPDTIRPRLVFEVASEMMGATAWPYREARVELRSQGDESGVFRLYGANHPDSIQEVAERKLDIGILNPAAILTMAYRGVGAFRQPLPVATIAVLPHYDQLGFAVTHASGITSLDQIREQHYPLRVSVRGSLDASTSLLVNVVLKTHGFSLQDIVSWGGQVSYDQPMPNAPSRIGRVPRGELDAIFEEGIMTWGNLLSEAGMRFLPIDESHLAQLQAQGFRRGTIEKSLYHTLDADVPTVDFSGWPIFTHQDASDLFIKNFCAALRARRQRIQWQIGGLDQPPLPLEQMTRDSRETPLEVPLHPEAERFWRENGIL